MTDKDLAELVSKYAAEQRVHEVVWFYRAVEKIHPRAKVIVEIGIKEGGNLKILSTHLDDDGVVIGIDPRQDIPWKMQDCECAAYHISASSHLERTVEELELILNGRSIDVLFIDGDHSYEGMVADYNDYSPLVRAGGLIAVHDIYYLEEVTAAWKTVSVGQKLFESPRTHDNIGIGYIVK